MSEEREQLEARIAAYIDGELSEAEAARLEVFLANTDPQLAEQVIGMMGDKQHLHALPRPAAPADLASRVMERVERATLLNDVEHLAQPRRSWWQSRAATAAAIIVLVGGFGWLVIRAVTGPVKESHWPQLTDAGKDQHKPVPPPTLASADSTSGRIAPTERKSGPAQDGVSIAEGPKPGAATPMAPGARLAKKNDHVDVEKALASAKSGGGAKMAEAAGQPPAPETDKLAQEKTVQEQLATSSNILNGAADAGTNGYVSTESAAQALSTLSVSGSQAASNPIVVTLIAQDNQDPAKLQTALEEFMAKDSTAARQKPLFARYAEGHGLFSGNTVAGNNAANGAIDNTIGNVANNSTNGAAGKSAGNALALNSNSDGYLIYNSGQFDQVDNNFNNDKARTQTIANNRQNSEQYPSQNAAQGQYDNNTLALPYRVMLREDQLQQLAGKFRVYSLSSGSQKFIINESALRVATAAPATSPPAKAMDALSDESGRNAKAETAGGASAPATQPAAPAAQVQAEGLAQAPKDRDERTRGMPAPAPVETKQPAPAAEPQHAPEMQQTAKLKWLDCVIRMEPSPVRANTGQQAAPAAPITPQAK